MSFGPVQSGIFWLVVGSGALMGVPERVAVAVGAPSAENLASAFFSAGLVFLLSLLKLKPF